ncbi:MAG: response regulator [Gammaproteobacteria bacterium]|nr:response regulator [Gammaproteobacteria bacterium]
MTEIKARKKEQSKPRILVADDSRVVRVSAKKILGNDFEVVLADHGEEAWDQLSQDTSIQVVITDLAMPWLDGFDLLKRIRASQEKLVKSLPVVVITGTETDDTREQVLRLGATDFITKPFNRIDLLARAKSLSESQRTARALKKEAEELEKYATVDQITQLGNKRYFAEKLVQDWSFCTRHKQDLTVMRIDVDNAKQLVRSIGKEKFIALLRELGSIIKACIRKEDSAARLDSVKFGVLLPTCNSKGATVIAKRIQDAICIAGNRRADLDVPLTVSVGIATPGNLMDISAGKVASSAESAVIKAIANGANSIVANSEVVRPKKPKQSPPSMDDALALIGRGDIQKIKPHLPDLLKRVIPLLRLASAAQINKIIAATKRD